MAKTLATTVVVYDADNQRHEFTPGSEVPEWAEKIITNLKAWAPEESDETEKSDDADEQEEKPAESSARRNARRSRS